MCTWSPLFLFPIIVNCITLYSTGIYPACQETKTARAKIVAECKVSVYAQS